MIVKSYEFKKTKSLILKNNFFLLYGENFGLKKDIKNFISNEIKQKDNSIETLSLYENDITNDQDNFFNSIYSGSLFSKKKIITIYEVTDKMVDIIQDAFEKYSEDVYLIFFSNILEKRSKLRTLFEKEKKMICTACYLDNEKDLFTIAQLELKKK